MVTDYINNFCKYRLDKLQNVVYLISKNALRTIEIDVPFAFVSGITESPIALKTTSISLTEDDTLDERYEFTHTLTFTVDGYANYTDFQGRYYAIVKNYDGKYWLINPLFPSKVTYEYTLDANGSRTEFTMATASNHPTLLAVGFDAPTPYECNGYNLCGIDRLFLNEKAYSSVDNNGRIYYTNDGFKEVVFDKNSATFKEIFNGDTVQHQIDFNIKFDDYKSSWHYNLLEFVDNTYSSVISTRCGTYIMSGFNFGLQPSFSVSADETTTPNNIGITLVDAANSGSFINLVSGTSFNPITTTEWIYTSENDGWECVGNGIAMYLLKKEVDAFGNPSGHYLAYSGYTSYFEEKGLIIDGEFDEEKTFISSECVESGCTLSTSLLNTIKMRPQTCTLFELQCESDWDITSSSSFLLFNPSSGVANSAYTVEICNNVSQSSLSVSGEFSINYCDNKHFDVTVQISKQIDTCFPQGQEFNINALAQWVNIPTNCCVDSVENSAITNVQIGNGWVKVYVPQNFTFTARTFTLVFTMCNGTTVDVIINQDRIYERWVSAGLVCRLTQQCTLLKRYTGLTPSSIDTYTYETQFVDCAPSPDCSNGSYWVQTTATTCDNGRKYYVEEEMIWDGTSWVASGNQRIGEETEDSPAECSGGTPTYEYRWVLTDEWECNGTTKRYLYKYQQRISGSSDAWSDVVPTRTSYNGEGTMAESAITNSTDCGYVPPVEPQYKWVRMDITTDYICDECPTPQYRTLTTATTCVGVDKYTLAEYQVSYDSGTTWTTTATSATTLIEANSTDCGYSARTLTTGWTCQGYDKYELDEYQVSYDSGVTWTTTATSATTLIEANSEDCGYEPPTPPTPTGFTAQYLTLVPRSASTTFMFSNNTINYSLDSGSTWVSLAANTATPSVGVGDKIMFKASGLTINYGIGKFSGSSQFDVEGNAMSMIYGDDFIGQTSLSGKNYALEYLFSGSSVVSAENLVLPATELSSWCYSRMFKGCTSLTVVPQLSATTLANGCYANIFEGCTSLTTVPSDMLPSTTLATRCYQEMFSYCSGLTVAPQLPSTALTDSCYSRMFAECSALTEAPILSAETLASSCYNGIFYYCSSLNAVTCLATDISASNCTNGWLSGVASSGTFYKNPNMSSWTSGYSGIPTNWTIIDYSN